MAYESLLNTAHNNGLYVYEVEFISRSKGFIRGEVIGIEKHLLQKEKACVLAEEIGHRYTGVGNILDQSDIRNRKQELKAREWAHLCMIPYERIIKAHKARVSGRYELAEYLGVTERFLQAAIDRYTNKHGLFLTVDERYTITFDPLGVIEMFHGD